MRVIDVGGQVFSMQALIKAIRAPASKPLSLRVQSDGASRTVAIDYRGGLRYPHLERIAGTPDLLSDLLNPR